MKRSPIAEPRDASLDFIQIREAADTHGHLTSGRVSVDFETAERLLVADPRFNGSSTRRQIWDGVTRFLGAFVEIETKFQKLLEDESLLVQMWLGGSFASSKLDPRNADMTLFIDTEARNKFKGQPGSKTFEKLIKSRDKVQRDYLVSPIIVNYHRVPHLFNRNLFTDQESEYFLERGRWDDWWQRVRTDDVAPTLDSCIPRRGYLEVKLR